MQLFSNRAATTLSVIMGVTDTWFDAADTTMFSSPTGGNYELLTLTDGTSFEVVKMTANGGTYCDVTRAQEGTAAVEWPIGTSVFAGITKGTLETFVPSLPPTTTPLGANSVNIQPARGSATNVASGAQAIAVGRDSKASGSGSTAVGYGALASGSDSVVVGTSASEAGGSGVSIGANAVVNAAGGVALGAGSETAAADAIALGRLASANATNAVALGRDAEATVAGTLVLGAVPVVSSYAASAADSFRRLSAPQVVIMTPVLNFIAGATHTPTIPAGLRIFVEEVGVIVTTATAVATQPSVTFGVSGDAAKFLAATTTTGLTAAGHRERFTTLASADGSSSGLTASVSGAAGTAMTGRLYFKGFVVMD